MSELAPSTTTLLRDSASWPDWYTEFQMHALQKAVWVEVDPDAPDVKNINEEYPSDDRQATQAQLTLQVGK